MAVLERTGGPPVTGSREAGFTLLEVMVALAILGIGILMVIQLFAGGLGVAASARDHTSAVFIAREKMAEALTDGALRPKVLKGEEPGGFEWRVDVSPYDNRLTEKVPGLEVLKVVVKVNDRGGSGGGFTLTTLKSIVSEG